MTPLIKLNFNSNIIIQNDTNYIFSKKKNEKERNLQTLKPPLLFFYSFSNSMYKKKKLVGSQLNTTTKFIACKVVIIFNY